MMRQLLGTFWILILFCTFMFGGCAPQKIQLDMPERPVAEAETIFEGEPSVMQPISPETPEYQAEPLIPEEKTIPPPVVEETIRDFEMREKVEEAKIVPSLIEPRPIFAEPEPIAGKDIGPPLGEGIARFPEREELDARIMVYQEKLSQWNALRDNMLSLDLEDGLLVKLRQCMRQAEQILSNYELLQENITSQEPVKPVLPAPWEFFKQDILFLESECEVVFSQASENVNQWLKVFNKVSAEQLEMVIEHFAAADNYKEVLASYDQLTKAFPEWETGQKVKTSYAKALIQAGNFNKAIAVLKGVREDLEGAETDIHKVEQSLADLLFAAGKQNEAKAFYQALADYFLASKNEERWVSEQLIVLENADLRAVELEPFLTVLKNYIVFDGKNISEELRQAVWHLKKKFPHSLYSQRAQQILQTVEVQVRNWVNLRINLANDLVYGKDFPKAIAILEELQGKSIPGDLQEEARITLAHVREAEKLEIENQRQILGQSLAIQHEEALKLLDSQRYDEAIAAFTGLIGTIYDDEARENINKAANLAANTMRRQAAGLFVKSRKTDDLERKRYLLQESHRLLKEIIDKYPNVDIIFKVEQNLAVLEENIKNLFPDILGKKESDFPAQEDRYAPRYQTLYPER